MSQGNKWCDFCKIFISNNPLSVRNHDLGKRHKDNVAARLATMRKESAAKEKEQKVAAKALAQIESVSLNRYFLLLEKDFWSINTRFCIACNSCYRKPSVVTGRIWSRLKRISIWLNACLQHLMMTQRVFWSFYSCFFVFTNFMFHFFLLLICL